MKMYNTRRIHRLINHIWKLSKICERNFSINSMKCKKEYLQYFGDKAYLHRPGENFKSKNYIITEHTNRLMKEHLLLTGGQVRTRFPPEPNGLLHIGHAKAININFGFAQAEQGICYLRYDDTNPEMEEETFVHGIQEMIEWLDFKAYQVTYASDYFQQLYDWAEKLIEKDLAYVCHSALKTVKSECEDSPWRNRPIKESLHEFKAMKKKAYKEGEATLRLKMRTQQGTVDPVAYRIKYAPHHRTKEEWCIYPTYDYAHGLCDSIQNITHSLCTSEFALRRSTYYWICNALEVYCPVQTEYGRLNFLYTVVSKRKINTLIEGQVVKGWDDPRLYTLAALKRRGIPPEAINAFCRNFGLRKDNAFIHPAHLHHYVRDHLQKTATRIMSVLKPLRVIIENFGSEDSVEVDVLNVPSDPSKGSHTATFGREVWIEETDFMESADKRFYRLTLNQGVGLRHTGCVITVKEIVRNSEGGIDHLRVESTPAKEAKKPRAYIHWVANPVEVEVNMYENLFMSERPDDPKSVPGGLLSDVNPASLSVWKALVGAVSLDPFQPFQRFQFERVGYFTVDPDSTKDSLVFNRVVTLKQDKNFGGGAGA